MPTRSELEASLHTLDILLIVFGLLVAIGVTGESIFGFLHWRRNNQLTAIQDGEIARLSKETAEAKRDTARARLELLKLERRTAPRNISPQKQSSISSSLELYRPSQSVPVFASKQDAEIELFTQQLAGALERADWPVSRGTKTYHGRISIGVAIEMTATAPQSDWVVATVLSDVLRKAEIDVYGPHVPDKSGFSLLGNIDDKDAPIQVIVGEKISV